MIKPMNLTNKSNFAGVVNRLLTVASFIRIINRDKSLNVSEDCQNDLLY